MRGNSMYSSRGFSASAKGTIKRPNLPTDAPQGGICLMGHEPPKNEPLPEKAKRERTPPSGPISGRPKHNAPRSALPGLVKQKRHLKVLLEPLNTGSSPLDGIRQEDGTTNAVSHGFASLSELLTGLLENQENVVKPLAGLQAQSAPNFEPALRYDSKPLTPMSPMDNYSTTEKSDNLRRSLIEVNEDAEPNSAADAIPHNSNSGGWGKIQSRFRRGDLVLAQDGDIASPGKITRVLDDGSYDIAWEAPCDGAPSSSDSRSVRRKNSRRTSRELQIREGVISDGPRNSPVAEHDGKNAVDDRSASCEQRSSRTSTKKATKDGKTSKQESKKHDLKQGTVSQVTAESSQTSSYTAAKTLVNDHNDGTVSSSPDLPSEPMTDEFKTVSVTPPGSAGQRSLNSPQTFPNLGDSEDPHARSSSKKMSTRTTRRSKSKSAVLSSPKQPDRRKDPKVRAIMEAFDEEIGTDMPKLEGVFSTYCSEKTWEGDPLLNCENLKEFFEDWESAFPHKVAPSVEKVVSCYGSELQLQIDFCSRVKLAKAEASRGLCFETFKVVLQSLISKYWHVGIAQAAFDMYSSETLLR
eukprot:gnl/MRDRNA2_/MRDRNA2_109705_c0_seq1.p1 gnl/MRDRNA2_/MRDRNA2_109705_c0~~gnl/MRDRNA2_/MRDRNA2_109705_c0_seq1.p1  ORF type:complete len:580 (+),score=103.53 gnl/MRDRNA2_/MRDRNA2_109705_c0_seq1:94-1833(+)